MHWETKKMCELLYFYIHFIAVVWNWTHEISEVCLCFIGFSLNCRNSLWIRYIEYFDSLISRDLVLLSVKILILATSFILSPVLIMPAHASFNLSSLLVDPGMWYKDKSLTQVTLLSELSLKP